MQQRTVTVTDVWIEKKKSNNFKQIWGLVVSDRNNSKYPFSNTDCLIKLSKHKVKKYIIFNVLRQIKINLTFSCKINSTLIYWVTSKL